MKNFKKKMSLLALVAIMISQTFLTSLGLPLQVSANSEQSVFTNVEMTDEAGRIIDAEQFPDHSVAIDSNVQLTISWMIGGESVAVGEAHSMQLPAELVLTSQEGTLTTTDKKEVGTYKVTDKGEVILRFIEDVNDGIGGNGILTLLSTFNEELINGESEVPFTFLLNGGSHTIIVPFITKILEDEEETEEETEEEIKDSTPESKTESTNEENGIQEEESVTVQNVTMSATEITENILTGVEVTDENGEILQSLSTNHIALGDLVGITYHWSLPNGHGYSSGATFTFQLPDAFQLYNDIENEPLLFSGTKVGTFTVTTDRKVTITFNEMIEQLSNINGMLQVLTEIRADLQGSVRQEIVFEAKDNEIARIPVQFEVPSASMIDKQGMVDKGYNASEITWTIDFNKQMQQLENAILQDPIQEGQALQAGSIKVYELDVQLDGSVVQGDELDPGNYSVEKVDGGDFQILFGSIDSSYRVVFVTDINDGDATTYRNVATLIGDNIDDLPADATVFTQRGVPLSKTSTGYNSATQTITWEIKYNYNEKSIEEANAFLTDLFTSSHELVENSLQVQRVTIDEFGNEIGTDEFTDYTIEETSDDESNGFILQFNRDINNAYKIIYQTTSSERVLDTMSIENEVTTGDKLHTKEAKRTIGQVVFHKHRRDIDYQNKTVKWELVLNEDKYEMTNVTISDVFANGGLTLIEDSFTVNEDGEILEKEEDYQFNFSDEGFTIEFANPIKKPLRITYVTTFDYDARDDSSRNVLDNVATLEWQEDIDNELVERSKIASAVFAPDTFTRSNGFKNGSFNAVTKMITWDIGVNYNLQTFENAVVEDFIQEGQNFISDSIEVFEMKLTGGTNGVEKGDLLTKGTDYEIVMVDDAGGNPGFQVKFLNTMDSPYWISFTTSLDERLIKKIYQNVATLNSSNADAIPLDASVSVQHGGEYVNKSGAQNGKVIDWRININFAQSTVSNAKIIDEPSPNQILLEDTFRLFATNVQPNGTMTKGDELKRGVDYNLEITTESDGLQFFELSFPDVIDTGYILEYQSFINAQNNESVTNQVSFKGDEITKNETTDTSESIQVRLSSGSGTGSGERGSIEVTKVDAATGKTLEGASFTLYDSEGQIAIRTIVTGTDGKATFINLLYNDYLLREDSAPEGYLIGINDTKLITLDLELQELTVENEKIIRDVQLRKVDNETGESLQGAVFALQQWVDNELITILEVETDENGIVYVEDLEPGDYQFVELSAPFGYKLDAESIPFTIREEQTDVIELEKENQIILGAVELIKMDLNDSSIVLEGAEFSLLDEEGNVLLESLTTDKEGKLAITDLRPGNYQFDETSAPEHYHLNDTSYPFTIVKSQEKQLTVTATNQLIPGSVQLVKVDADDSSINLEGAAFSLLDEEGNVLLEGLTTDENGQVTVNNLRPGDYQFVETAAPEHYILNDTSYPFTIVKSQEEQLTVTATNQLIPGSVQLVKVDADDSSINLEGAEFSLLDEEGNVLLEDLMTDENGQLVVADLKPGDYQFVETSAPEHYLLNDTSYPFTIVKSQEEQLIVSATNQLIPGSVQLVKVDADDSSINLEGAEFSLLDEEGNVLLEGLMTDENGQYVVSDLKPGEYQFVETAAPEHYILNDTPHTFTIERSQEDLVTVVMENDLIRGSVQLVKVDVDDPSIVLEGAEFSLLDEEGNVLLEGLMTDENGQLVVADLKPGDYQFIETSAPEHYLLNDTSYPFTIVKSQEKQLTVTATNQLIPGSVQLVKVDADDSSINLEGAAFSLLDEEGNVLFEGLTTDENGQVTVNNLRPGDYQFVETAAPEHYILNDTPHTFTIERSQEELVTVVVENDLILGSVQLVKVDVDDPSIVLEGAEFSLLDEEGNVLLEGLTTDKNGQYVVSDLKPGEYQFVETAAPFGYQLDKTPVSFTIEKSQDDVLSLVVGNKAQPEQKVPNQPGSSNPTTGTGDSNKSIDKLPYTGEEFLIYIIALGLLFMTIGGILLLGRRRMIES